MQVPFKRDRIVSVSQCIRDLKLEDFSAPVKGRYSRSISERDSCQFEDASNVTFYIHRANYPKQCPNRGKDTINNACPKAG